MSVDWVRMDFVKKVFSFVILTILYINSVVCLMKFPEDLKSKNILLYNLENDSILFERNIHEKVYPASITKIVTYIVVYENLKDSNVKIVADEKLLKSLDGTQSSLANLKPGSSYSVDQLLKSMMICSGNDSALILANYCGGDVPSFVSMMNEKSKDIGCECTNFNNPHGLHHKDHYSTCYDLLKIIKYALKIKEFRDTVKSRFFYLDGNKLVNTNKLLDPENPKYYVKYCYGIKTGSHDEAGFCLSSIAGNENGNYICICLGAPMYDDANKKLKDNYAMLDSKKIYDWVFKNYRLVNFPINLLKYPIVKTKKFDVKVDLEIKPFSVLIPTNMKISDIKYKFNVPHLVKTSIEKGSYIGTLFLDISPNTSKQVEILAKKSISINFYQKFVWIMSFI